MRWIHSNSGHDADTDERARIISLIDEWWQDFDSKTKLLDAAFRGRDAFDVTLWTEQWLEKISPNLMWEYGPAADGHGHRLVVTCETHCELRPLVAIILDRAPEIKGWEFLQWRPPESLQRATEVIQSQLGIKLTGVTAAVSVGEDQRIDLTFRWPEPPTDAESAFDAAFVATELLVGEQQVEHSVGLIQLADQESSEDAGHHFHNLDRLNPTFEALRNSMLDQLPADPFAARVEDLRWALLELKPEESVEYANRDDLVTAVTCDPDLFGATFAEGPFYSSRFSRCNEVFCYIKVDGQDVSDVKFPDREEMEEAVRQQLEDAGCGCLIGSGTGLRYSYLEVALSDLNVGINELRKVLAVGNVPHRSWLLFHDADLRNEWVGIYDDTPPPPLTTI